MAIDRLQEKIRKSKNPTILEFSMDVSQLPAHILAETESAGTAYARACVELMEQMKGIIPAVRFSFSAFALLGHDGLYHLSQTLQKARELGYYVVLDAPEILSVDTARRTAECLLGQNSLYLCDGLLISGYLGSDGIKPFLPYCGNGQKDLFVVARTANKSAPEVQDLLAGSRLVHTVVADHVNRYGVDTAGKFGYAQVGILAAASNAESLRILRSNYPKRFLLIDGYDYPNANAKNCSFGFDRFGHGAVVCGGSSITCAWKQGESDGRDYLEQAKAAAERMRKNLLRYVTIL